MPFIPLHAMLSIDSLCVDSLLETPVKWMEHLVTHPNQGPSPQNNLHHIIIIGLWFFRICDGPNTEIVS